MKVLVATALYPTPENPAWGSFVKTQVDALNRFGVEAVPFVLEGRSRKWMYVRAVRGIRRALSQGDYDLVHAHYGYVGMVGRLQRHVPLVVTYHGDDLLGSVKDARGRHTLGSRVAVVAGRALGQLADAVIVQSDEMAARLWRESGVHVVPHEVDLDLFRPVDRAEARRELGLKPDGRYVLFAANPRIPVKNFPLAERAMRRVIEELPEAEMVVVHKEPQDRLVLLMNACDALIFPSFQEGSPNIVKQAMACGLPIVATGVGDVREIVGDTAGCTICSRDEREFARALVPLLRDPMRTQGRRNVEHLDCESVVQRVIDVYRSVLEPGRSSVMTRDGDASTEGLG